MGAKGLTKSYQKRQKQHFCESFLYELDKD